MLVRAVHTSNAVLSMRCECLAERMLGCIGKGTRARTDSVAFTLDARQEPSNINTCVLHVTKQA